jgi:hypothetical protein
MIGEESSAMSLGDNRLYFYSHGDALGSGLISGQDAKLVTASRDVPHAIEESQRGPVLPFGQDELGERLMSGADGASSIWSQPAVIADGKIFYVFQGMTGMYQSGFSGETQLDTGGNVVQLSALTIANELKSSLPVVLK